MDGATTEKAMEEWLMVVDGMQEEPEERNTDVSKSFSMTGTRYRKRQAECLGTLWASWWQRMMFDGQQVFVLPEG
jgi:hypothetical protein